jgi:hypothetical protein
LFGFSCADLLARLQVKAVGHSKLIPLFFRHFHLIGAFIPPAIKSYSSFDSAGNLLMHATSMGLATVGFVPMETSSMWNASTAPQWNAVTLTFWLVLANVGEPVSNSAATANVLFIAPVPSSW